MCGIVAIHSSTRPICSGDLRRSLEIIRHRGPDGEGTWLSSDSLVGLGHVRLSIIDLSGGRQPIANETDDIHIIVNGEFYEHEDIRRDLVARGHRFRTRSDSEIALHLYEDYGSDCLRYLRGEFAFVIWDGQSRRLFAARDRFGIKPLYYSTADGILYLASEIKSLLAAGIPAQWDEDGVQQQIFLCAEPDRTLFSGIRQLSPGHCLIASRERLLIKKYWDFDYPSDRDEVALRRKESDYVEGVRHALEDAVSVRLRSDVPVGAFLSGGVDSSAVFGMAARRSTSPLRAFTISFSGAVDEESSFAQKTCEWLGAEFQSVRLGDNDLADHIEESVWHGEMLGMNTAAIARYSLCKAIRAAGYKVVFSGDGADEVFCGYSHFRSDLMRRPGSGCELNGGSEVNVKEPRRPSGFLDFVRRNLGFAPEWMRKLSVERAIFYAVLASDFAERCEKRDPGRALIDCLDLSTQLRGRHPLLQSAYLWSKSMLPNYILYSERLEMASGVEVRLPFLDHKLIEVVGQVPVSLLGPRAGEKLLLRNAARRYLTEGAYARGKHPFIGAPFLLRKGNRVMTLVQDTLRSEALSGVPFFDRKKVVGLLDSLPGLDERTAISLEPAVLMMLSACILHRRFHL